MAAFSQLPSGKWRVQVRKAGIYRDTAFDTKREAKDWDGGVTIAGDLSHLSQIMKWAKHARQLDVNERLACRSAES